MRNCSKRHSIRTVENHFIYVLNHLMIPTTTIGARMIPTVQRRQLWHTGRVSNCSLSIMLQLVLFTPLLHQDKIRIYLWRNYLQPKSLLQCHKHKQPK